MIATINNFQIDLSKPIDISLPLSNTDANPIAWYIEKPVIEPVTVENWIGKVSEGSEIFNVSDNTNKEQALSALVMLGFAKSAVIKVLDKIAGEEKKLTVEDMIRKALKNSVA